MVTSETYLVHAQQAENHAKAGNVADAVLAYQKALQIQPRFYRGWISLSKLEYQLGNYNHALKALENAERCDPLAQDFSQVQQAIGAKDFNHANDLAKNMLDKAPGHPRAVFTIAHIYAAQGAQEERAEILKQGLEISPANLSLRHMLMGALEDSGQIEEAIETARHIVEIQESFPSLWMLMGICLRYGLNQEARDVAIRAEQYCANDNAKMSEVNLVRGQALRILGRRDESVEALRACIANEPQNSDGWWALADMKNFKFSSAERMKLETLVDSPQKDDNHKSMTAFALAKSMEVEGDLNSAMPYYIRANELRPDIRFDADGFLGAVDRVLESFPSEALKTQAKNSKDDPQPIFIVGMPRSGSTLVEQILASHSQIEGTIELPVLPRIKRKIHSYYARHHNKNYLGNLANMDPKDLGEFGQAYLKGTAMFRPENAPYFTDKLPLNFEHVGLIHKILPNAIIIDARRNPMDCGLSIYKQYFAAGSHFSYNLEHIGAYYNGYLKMMDHWDKVLPGKVLHVQYEELVQNTEAGTRAMLAHIGVDFEESCLRFYENKRAVRTASSEQVRQPIFTSSLGVWKTVEEHLAPLQQSLGKQTLKRFEKFL